MCQAEQDAKAKAEADHEEAAHADDADEEDHPAVAAAHEEDGAVGDEEEEEEDEEEDDDMEDDVPAAQEHEQHHPHGARTSQKAVPLPSALCALQSCPAQQPGCSVPSCLQAV